MLCSIFGIIRLVGSVIIWTTIFIPSVSCDCFFPNGVVTIDTDFAKCPNSPSCCALKRPFPPGSDVNDFPRQDECLPNGVCQNRYTVNGVMNWTYWRDSCSSSDWDDGGCLNVCTDGNNFRGITQITPCDNTNTSEKWCCGDTNECCASDSTDAVFIAATLLTSTSSSASPSNSQTSSGAGTTSTPSTTSTSRSPSSSTDAAPKTSSGGLSTGAKAGIGVGAAVGALLVFGLGFFIAKSLGWRKKLRASASTPAQHQGTAPESYDQPVPYNNLSSQWSPHDSQYGIGGNRTGASLDNNNRQEMREMPAAGGALESKHEMP